jgi:hypothetical protein
MPMFVLSMLPSCSREDPRVAPSKSEIEAKIKTTIPPFLSVTSLENEVIPDAKYGLKINFKAKVKPLEDLYIQDRNTQGEFSMIILKVSQSNGTEARLYGSMYAERTMDQWNMSRPEIDSGLEQLGRPRGSFDSRAMIDGSDELKKFIADREAVLAEHARIDEENRKKSEEARIALIEEKRRENEAIQKKLIDATAVGKRYQGVLVQSPGSSETRQAVELEFTSQSGTSLSAVIHNPDQPAHKQTFTGELVFQTDPNPNREDNRHYPIMLSPKKVEEYMNDRFRIYFEKCVVSLELTDHGIEGKAYAADSNSTFAIRLQPAQ